MANGVKGTARGKAAGAVLRIVVATAIVAAGLAGCGSQRAWEAIEVKTEAVTKDGTTFKWDIARVDGRWFEPERSRYSNHIVTYMRCEDGSVWLKEMTIEHCEVRFDAEGEDDAWAEYDDSGNVMTLHLPRSAEG